MACCSTVSGATTVSFLCRQVQRPVLIGIATTMSWRNNSSGTAYSPAKKSRPPKEAAEIGKEQPPVMKTSRHQNKKHRQTVVAASSTPQKKKLKGNLHILKDLYPWKSKAEFTQHLVDSVIYNSDGLVAINKPYGIPLRKALAGTTDNSYSIEESLDGLASALKVSRLVPLKITERYTSGVSIFTSAADADQVQKRMKRSYQINYQSKMPTYNYWAITLGEPKPLQQSTVGRIGISFITHQQLKGKLPVVMQEYSKSQVKDGLIEEFQTLHKTLAKSGQGDEDGNDSSSLVQVDLFSSPQHHFIRVLLAHLLSPVLGDHMYGNRVANILGTRLPISPVQADSLATFHKIPSAVLQRLQLTDPSLMPTCIHLRKLTLSRFKNNHATRNGDSTTTDDVVIEADPPPYFHYVCRSLNLLLPIQPNPPLIS